MRWTGCVRSEKLRHVFVPRTFALVHKCFAPSFVRQSNGRKCTQMVWNAPNMSLGSNGVDRVGSLRKILTRLRGTNFCTSSACFAPSFVRQHNGPKCTQMVWNTPKHEFMVQWGGSGAFVAKNTISLRGTNFCINWTCSVCFETSFLQLRNDPKCTQILRNASKH